MNVEIFVHGVPNGESFWGEKGDRNYFGGFYDQSCSDKVRFLIQTRSSNGKVYCYYNYLLYKDIIGNEGRGGSYFGLSVRLDAYCKDFIGIYKILDTVFAAHVLNKVLKVQNGKYKYVIADFGSAPEMMDNIKKAVWQLLQSTLTGESVCGLGGFDIGVGGGSLPTGNLYETTADGVEATVKQYGKIALSPYYTTVREKSLAKQCESKIQSVSQQYEAKLNAKEQERRSLNDSLASSQRDCAKLQDAIKLKDSEIARLNNLIRQIEQTKNVTKNIELIKTPIMELAGIFEEQGQYGKGKIPKKRGLFSAKRLILLVVFTILVFIVVLLLLKFII